MHRLQNMCVEQVCFHSNRVRYDDTNRELRDCLRPLFKRHTVYSAIKKSLKKRATQLTSLTSIMSVEGQFFLSITGSIEHAEFYDADNVYCKYSFHFGPEWNVVTVSSYNNKIKSKKAIKLR